MEKEVKDLPDDINTLKNLILKKNESLAKLDKVIIAERYRGNKFAEQRASLFKRIEELEDKLQKADKMLFFTMKKQNTDKEYNKGEFQVNPLM